MSSIVSVGPSTKPPDPDASGPNVWVRLRPGLIAFVSSACLMAVEMVAGRLVSRHIGSSLYTWTAVIGVIFAGMSVGNYLGGRLASDRRSVVTALGDLLLLSAFLCVSVIWLNKSLQLVHSTAKWPGAEIRLDGSVTLPESLATALMEDKAPEAVQKLVAARIGQEYPDLATLGHELSRAFAGLALPESESQTLQEKLLLAAEPIGPAYQMMREEGLPDEALSALCRTVDEKVESLPDPTVPGAKPETRTVTHFAILGTVGGRDSKDDLTSRVRRALEQHAPLRHRMRDEYNRHLSEIQTVLTTQEPSDAAFDLMLKRRVPEELVARLRSYYHDGAVGSDPDEESSSAFKKLPMGARMSAHTLAAEVRRAVNEGREPSAELEEDPTYRALMDAKLRTWSRSVVDCGTDHGPFSFPVRLTLMVAVVFLTPAVALGLIAPVAAQLALQIGGTAAGGRAIGNVYAWGAWGSIAGTFLAGFYLISALGCFGVIAASTLTLSGLALVSVGPRLLHGVWFFGLSLLLLPVFHQLREPDGLCTDVTLTEARNRGQDAFSDAWDRWPRMLGETLHLRDPDRNEDAAESNYQFLKVTHASRDFDGRPGELLTLSLDHLVHGYVAVTTPEGRDFDAKRAVFNPRVLEYDYEMVYAVATARSVRDRFQFEQIHEPGAAPDTRTRLKVDLAGRPTLVQAPKLTALFIGGGTYTFQRYLCQTYIGEPFKVIGPKTLSDLAREHYNCRTERDTLDTAGRLFRHNSAALSKWPLPAGLALELPMLDAEGEGAALLESVPARIHVTTAEESLHDVVAKHVGKRSAHRLTEVLERLSRDHYDELAAAVADRPLPIGIELNLPTLSDVAELDPAVTQFNYERLYLARPNVDPRVKTWNYDARNFVEAAVAAGQVGKYDVIYGDAFNHYSVPYHLTTREFNEQLSKLLTPRGAYVFNVIDKYRPCRFMSAVVTTLRKTFKYVYVFGARNRKTETKRETFVVVASNAEQPYALLGVVSPQRMELIRRGDVEGLSRRMRGQDDPGLEWLTHRLTKQLVKPSDLAEEVAVLMAVDRFSLPGADAEGLATFGRNNASLTEAEIDAEVVNRGRPLTLGTALRTSLLSRSLGRSPRRFEYTEAARGTLLQEDRVPEEVLKKLDELVGQRFRSVDRFGTELARRLTSAELRAYKSAIVLACRDLGVGDPLVLSDDHAPVDDLLSSLFEEE